MGSQKDFILFGGSSHPVLLEQISAQLQCASGRCHLGRFPDGETFVQILENVRGRHVFVLQSIALRPNDFLMELLVMIDALKRASAKSICVAIPYFGYSRQDRKDKPRVAITAKLVANLLETAGASRVLTMDLHADQLQGFFDIPLDNLFARPILVAEMQKLKLQNPLIAAPDIGSIKMARDYASAMRTELAVIDKKRIGPDRVVISHVIGDVKGKTVVLTDDICSTATTLVSAAEACMKAGAFAVYAAITHGLFAGQALQKIDSSALSKLLISNTIPGTDSLRHPKIETISIAPLFAKAIRCIVEHTSISSLFRGKPLP